MSTPETSLQETVQPGELWLRWESGGPPPAEPEDGRRQAETLFAELLDLPPQTRSQVLRQRRFRAPALVELLLDKSREAQPADPEQSDALAMMAALLALHLHKPGETTALVAVFLGRANCLCGNARRLMGNGAEAEIAFANTVSFLARSAGSSDRAFYCRSLALLRWEQGRIDEAASLLHYAARIFAENAVDAEEGTALALLGLLYLEEGDPQRAVPPLRQARLKIDRNRRPWLTVRTRLALALGMAQLRQLGRARWMLREAWELLFLLDDVEELSRAQWLEGRICSLLGPAEDADALLGSVRAKLLAERRVPEAALATLDLALHRAQSRRMADIHPLIEEVGTLLRGEEGLDIALRGLKRFERNLMEGKPPAKSAEGIAPYLRRTFRLHGFRVEPLPFA